MSEDNRIDCYVKNPAMIADLCREVMARLDREPLEPEEVADLPAMEAQLREIAKTIERLEKRGVPIPDVLRAEKTRLAAVLSVQDEALVALQQLADSLADVVREIRSILSRRKPQPRPLIEKIERVNSDRLPRTVLREAIIEALQMHGGRAFFKNVFEDMKQQLDGRFLPGDLLWQERKKWKGYAWQGSTIDERGVMIKEGIIKGDSPRGVWELSEEHRENVQPA